jgi:transposase
MAKRNNLINNSKAEQNWTIGIDLGDKWSRYCIIDSEGEVVEDGRVKTTPDAFEKHFAGLTRSRIAIEAGTHSLWASEQLAGLGHEVLVANPRELRGISHSSRKSDVQDAEKLARYARLDPTLLNPVTHRSAEMQEALNVVRARAVMIRMRTTAVNAVRSLIKPLGHRLPLCSTECFPKRCRAELTPQLLTTVDPLLVQIEQLTAQISHYDQRIRMLSESTFPDTKLLTQIPGVGPMTALTFVLTIADKTRFEQSRDVGCYLGLRPRRSQSGDRDPQLGITKTGNSYLRVLLVQSAHYILGRFGQDSAIRRWGLRLFERGGKNAKKRAVIAVARKLAVLLHRLWVTRSKYEPFYGCVAGQAK